MSSIDERIVQMKFNNKQFESGVQTSIKSLDDLKKGLNLEESTKSLQKLEKAGKNFSLDGIIKSVETISGKFTALGIMGVTVLQNLTNSAVNAGKRIVSALTIDPIKMGFQEYETQINAIQTILANTSSKGTTMAQVNSALDELNKYADKTIYNFTEMTRNIGTFTAAGVDLDTSVQAIKGIANLAAVSGSTSQQASVAMYQLSQALASGTVKLMDWNSVVNAGMGGQVFQDALKETARVHGVNIDKMIKTEGSFRETLQHGWLTSEILTETLSKFTGDLNEEQLKTMGYTQEQIKSIMEMGQMANDAATKVKTFTQLFDTLKEAAQSGWTQSWEIIVGDFEEAKELLTDVSDVFNGIIGASADARNEMLKGWKDLGGRTVLIESVRNAFQGISDVIAPIKEAFREIFPPMTGQQLFNLTDGLRKLTENFKISETTANNLKRTFKGVFALFDIGVKVVSVLFNGFFDLIGYIKPAGDGILGFTAGIGDFIVGINEALESSELFNKAIGQLTTTLGVVITWVTNFVGEITGAIKEFATADTSGLDSFTDKIKLRFEPFTVIGKAVTAVCKGIISIIEKAMPFVYSFSKGVADVFSTFTGTLADSIRNADYNNLLDLINTGLLGGILFGINKFVKSFGEIAKNASGFMENITDILDGVKGSLEAYQQTLKAKTLLTIAGAIGILAAALVAISLIDSNKLTTSLAAVAGLFIELFASMAIFETVMGKSGFKGIVKLSVAMIPLSTSVLILAVAMNKLAELDWDGVTKGLIAIAGLSATLVISANALSKSEGKLIKGAGGLVIFAGAIYVLSGAVEKLGALDLAALTKGLIGVGVLCVELALFLQVANFDKVGILKGVGFIAIATALNIIASAVSKLGALDITSLLKGLGAMQVVLFELALFMEGTVNAKNIISTAIGMNILGAAMLIFGSAIEKMGNLSLVQIGKGLATMALSLAAIVTAMNVMPANMIAKGVGMIGIATALVILSNALTTMGNMNLGEIISSLIMLAGSLGIISIAMVGLNRALPGAAALLVIAGALAILTPILKILGSMSLGEIAAGLLALAGMFVVIGGAAAILAPLTPVILALGAAITLFGIGCVAVAAGVLLFSTALSALAISGVAGAGALVTVITTIIGLIPMIVEQIGIAIVVFAETIAKGGVSILKAVTTIFMSLIAAVVEVTPALIDAVLILLTTLLTRLAQEIPTIVQAGYDILLGFLRGIRDNISDVVQTAIEIVLNFLDGIAQKIPDIVNAAYDLVITFIDGLAEGIEKNTPRLVEAIVNLGKAIIKGLIEGLKAGISSVINAIKEIGTSIIDGFKKLLGINSPSKEFKSLGGFICDGLILGIKNKLTEIKDAAVNLGKNLLNSVKSFLGIKSPSRVMRDEVGVYIVQGIAEGIKKDTTAEEAAQIKARNIVNAFKEEIDKADLDSTTTELENKLWNALNGDSVTENEKDLHNIETLSKKLEFQKQKLELAKGEYDVTVNTFGKDSQDSQKAYNKYLKEQIALIELQNEIEEAQKIADEKLEIARKAYYDYLSKNSRFLTSIGVPLQDILKEAEAVSGYKPTTDRDVKEIVSETVDEAGKVLVDESKETMGGITNEYSKFGISYTNAIGDSIEKTTPKVTGATKEMLEKALKVLKSSNVTWTNVGKELATSFKDGINSIIEKENVTTDLGDKVSNETSNVGKSAASSFKNALNMIGATIGGIAGLSPTIKPVVDLTNVVSSSKVISSLFDKTLKLNPTTSSVKASSISKSMGSNSELNSNNSNTESKSSSISFVQNNYSPKSLSASSVYRQTKTLLSTMKGAIEEI